MEEGHLSRGVEMNVIQHIFFGSSASTERSTPRGPATDTDLEGAIQFLQRARWPGAAASRPENNLHFTSIWLPGAITLHPRTQNISWWHNNGRARKTARCC
jgi:hypothetical protein